MASSTGNMYTSYIQQKGALSAEELALKDLLLRDQLTRYKTPEWLTGMVASPTPTPAPSTRPSGSGETPPIVAQESHFDGQYLNHVSAGDPITASYMNQIVDAVNGIIEFLNGVRFSNATTHAGEGPAPSARPGLAGIIKDMTADTGDDNMVTVKIPGPELKADDFEVMLYGNRRINPADLIKTEEGLSFKINRNDIGTDNPELMGVAKASAPGQQILSLFR